MKDIIMLLALLAFLWCVSLMEAPTRKVKLLVEVVNLETDLHNIIYVEEGDTFALDYLTKSQRDSIINR